MRRVACAIGLVTAVVFLAGRGGAAAQQSTSLEISGGVPGSALEIALNGGKIADTKPDEEGKSTSVLDLSNLGKVRVTVYVDRCEDGKTVKVQLVSEGNAPPPVDEGCDRKPAGVFWSDKGRVVIDVNRATVSTPGIPKAALIGGGAAAAIGVALATGGDSDSGTTNTPGTPAFNPTGTYTVTTTRKSDPGGHFEFVNLGSSGALAVTVNGSTIQIAGPGLQNWVTVTGTFDATGNFTANGVGTVAGRANVSVRFQGTITSSGALNGDLTMGVGGELPGNQPIVYGVTGQK